MENTDIYAMLQDEVSTLRSQNIAINKQLSQVLSQNEQLSRGLRKLEDWINREESNRKENAEQEFEILKRTYQSDEKIKARLNAIQERAEKLGVLDINISFDRENASPDVDVLECYESILDTIEENKTILNQNAGEIEEN